MPGVAAPEFASIPCFSVSSLTATIVALSLSLSRSLYLSISPSSSFIYSSSAFLFSKLTLLSCLVTLYVLKFSLQHFLFVSWCHFLSFIISDFLSAFQRWSYSSFALFNYSLIVLVFFLLLFVTSFWLFVWIRQLSFSRVLEVFFQGGFYEIFVLRFCSRRTIRVRSVHFCRSS
jgi:hypothetical protein